MNKSEPFKIVYGLVIAFTVLVVVPLFLYSVYVLFQRLYLEYPGAALLVTALITVYFVSAYIVNRVFYYLCSKKQNANKCSSKAININIFYAVVVCVGYIVISDWAKF